MISPKNKMTSVDETKPTTPPASSEIKMEKSEFTETFPMRIVQRSRLPLFLKGSSFLA
jgi:hypothetical protein